MTTSPYPGRPESAWLGITTKLIDKHPLKRGVLLQAAISTWGTLWQTTVGSGQTSVRLANLRVPATIVGYFFEILFAMEMERREPTVWRGSQSKDEKDLVYLPDPAYSVEIKTSGQCGFKVYGNRSYGQRSARDLPAKKEKSGYYITVNFFDQMLTLLRFGWIDADDWDPQQAPTGQMAGLGKGVYDYKLLSIPGSYRQRAPVIVLDGVGPKTEERLAGIGIRTVGELMHYAGELPRALSRIKDSNADFLADCIDKPFP
jgi:hypothetical protein